MESETDSSVTPVSELLRASGYWNPDWDAVAELDPIWTEKFMARGMHPVTAGVLEPKVLKFITIGVDASCTHLYASVRAQSYPVGPPRKRSLPSCRLSACSAFIQGALGCPSCSKK